VIRRVRPGDEAELAAMVHELAEFEKSASQCTLTEARLTTALFSDVPTAWAHIVEVDDRAAACAIWYRTFSTWEGVAGVYLEDLFVRSDFRRRGLARKLLAVLARECIEADGARLEWAVLDWNVDAIALYDAVGGKQQNEWITYRVSGPDLSALAASS
jgi:GNAT superfamily N-acetyltransferase